MAETSSPPGADEAEWRQRAVARSLNSARSRAEQRIQRFLDAAFALMDEKGSTEFTIQEVIDRSKQSMRGFYQYFDGKDELLLALFEETIREATDDLRTVRRVEVDPLERLHALHDPPARVVRAGRTTAQAGHAQPAPDQRVLGAAHGHASRPGAGRDGADLAHAGRALDAAVAAGAIEVADTRHAAALMQQTVMYSWFGNRLADRRAHAGHRRGDLGVLPPIGLRPAQTRSRSSIRIALPRSTL